MLEASKLHSFIQCLSDTQVVSYKTAKEQGLKFYLTIQSCSNGHISRRMFKERCCYTCYLERKRKDNKRWQKKNLKYLAAYHALRRSDKLCATPIWVDLKEINEFYKNCPNGYEVDHIVPLNGINVCGLHSIENLQYLTPLENKQKKNKVLLAEAA